MTFEEQKAYLESQGYFVGPRDQRLNTDHPGEFMVVEDHENLETDYELPTRDGANGPWCVVGDDLTSLVSDAYSTAFDMFGETP